VSNENNAHIEANLEVIRVYLIGQFKGFELTETPNHPLSHMFTATKSAEERYQVKVSWPQLSDKGNTPEKTKKRLVTDDVAGRMRGKSQGEYYWWG
jgi:hypothetical protein